MNSLKYFISFLAFFTLHKHVAKAAPAPEALDSLTLNLNIDDKKEDKKVQNNCKYSIPRNNLNNCKYSIPRNIWVTETYRHAHASCYFSSSAAGVNVSAFHRDVAHGIHSITVKDVKYYFDSSVPDQMSIPTQNMDLNGQHVLLSTPFGSEFSTPGMRLMDSVLSNDDGEDHFLVQGLSRMEKIAHQMHMLELWHKTSKVYQQIKANPPNEKVCSCLTDEDANGIISALEDVSIYLTRCENMDTQTRLAYTWWIYDYIRPGFTHKPPGSANFPDLKDAESWKRWKDMMNKSMLDQQGIYHVAVYLYCKIVTLAQI